MKKLMVSFDAGTSYGLYAKSEKVDELLSLVEKKEIPGKDISWTRWYIEDEDGKKDLDNICPIHGEIINMLDSLNRFFK